MIIIQQIIDIIATIFNAILWSSVFTITIWFLYYLKIKKFQHYFNSDDNKKNQDIECIKPVSKKFLGNMSEIELSSTFLEQFNDEPKIDPSIIIQHCMLIIKDCNLLTERLTTLSMGLVQDNEKSLKKIVDSAEEISVRFDDFVKGMHRPTNLQALEKQAASLLLAITRLAAIAKYECHANFLPIDWIETSLQEIEKYVTSLRFSPLISSLERNSSHKSIIY